MYSCYSLLLLILKKWDNVWNKTVCSYSFIHSFGSFSSINHHPCSNILFSTFYLNLVLHSVPKFSSFLISKNYIHTKLLTIDSLLSWMGTTHNFINKMSLFGVHHSKMDCILFVRRKTSDVALLKCCFTLRQLHHIHAHVWRGLAKSSLSTKTVNKKMYISELSSKMSSFVRPQPTIISNSHETKLVQPLVFALFVCLQKYESCSFLSTSPEKYLYVLHSFHIFPLLYFRVHLCLSLGILFPLFHLMLGPNFGMSVLREQ